VTTNLFAALKPEGNIWNKYGRTDQKIHQFIQSMNMTKEERERLWSERIEITIGGVELSSSLIDTPKGKNVEIFHGSVFKGEGEHQWMMDNTSMLNAMSENIIAGMDDEAKERLHRLVEQDNGKARLLYRLVMTRKLAKIGLLAMRVTDFIDPAFEEVDPKVVKRAAEVREVVEEVMSGET
jgi:hypothetical protein